MSTGAPNTEQHQIWGAPARESCPWGLRETLTAVGVAAVISALGGAAIYAATDSSSTPFGGPPGQHGPPGAAASAFGPASGPGPGPGPGPGVVRPGPPVHGEVVVADGSGGFVTMISQTGVVTAATADSMTVRSVDGYTRTWTTAAGQGFDVAVDDSVTVQGQQRAGQAAPTVTEVLDPAHSSR